MIHGLPDGKSRVRDVAGPTPPHLHEVDTVSQALARLRSVRNKEPVYFYVTDSNRRLIGVVPTRRLLFSEPSTLVGEVMINPVISVGESERFSSALALLSEQRLLALPVVDEVGHLTGVIDVSRLTYAIAQLERRERADEMFHMTALRSSQEHCGPGHALARRLAWLLVSMAGGLVCAALLYIFSTVLTKAITLAFFVPFVVMVAERIAAQTAGSNLRDLQIIRRRSQGALREWRIGLVLAGLSAVLGGIWVASWFQIPTLAWVVGFSVLTSSVAGLAAGHSVPRLIRHWHLERRIAMVPTVMALTDVAALGCYLVLATVLLK